ncbi:MAG: hypothetical protein ACN4GZ_16925 [Acidimicrobiales bacterium]
MIGRLDVGRNSLPRHGLFKCDFASVEKPALRRGLTISLRFIRLPEPPLLRLMVELFISCRERRNINRVGTSLGTVGEVIEYVPPGVRAKTNRPMLEI